MITHIRDWSVIPVFISSTFIDMHAERDYFVKSVFPQLSEWCERRHILLADVDLRWGVTQDDTVRSHTIRTCLRGVQRCRPFFLCILGQRRGWVPDPAKDEISPDTYGEFPELQGMAGKYSATELEIEDALLRPLLRIAGSESVRPQPDDRVLVLRRRDGYLADLSYAQRCVFTDEDPRTRKRLRRGPPRWTRCIGAWGSGIP